VNESCRFRHRKKTQCLKFSLVSKTKIIDFNFILLLFFRHASLFMNRVTFNIDGPEGANGANIFAGAAANAKVLINDRNAQAFFIGLHVHGLRGTMLRTRATIGAVRYNHAIFFYVLHDSYLKCPFFFCRYFFQCFCRADLGTHGAMIIAIPMLKIHSGLKYPRPTIFEKSRSQNIGRAFAYTKITGCAMIIESLNVCRTGRSNRVFTLK